MVPQLHHAAEGRRRGRKAPIPRLQHRTPRHAAHLRESDRLAHDHPDHALRASRLRTKRSPQDTLTRGTERPRTHRHRLHVGRPGFLAERYAAETDPTAAGVCSPLTCLRTHPRKPVCIKRQARMIQRSNHPTLLVTAQLSHGMGMTLTTRKGAGGKTEVILMCPFLCLKNRLNHEASHPLPAPARQHRPQS